jgi:hypothetical protein
VGPTSGVNSPRQYSPTIGPNETNGLSAKYTKIKTASCGAQLRGFNSCWRWAIVQGQDQFASIPHLGIEKTLQSGKSAPQKIENRPKRVKIAEKVKKLPREIGLKSFDASSGTPLHSWFLTCTSSTHGRPVTIVRD